MAFSAGQVSKEGGASTKYIGVGSVTVDGINPAKKELEAMFHADLESDPTYTGVLEQNGKQVNYARVDVVLHTVPENNNGIDAITRMGLFIRDEFRYNRDRTKIQVIDKYGRTAWVTSEELKVHAIPVYGNGRAANLDPDYRPCYVGEEDVTNFFKAFLNIPSPMVYRNKEWVPAENLQDCLARFDNVKNVFKGDFSEFVEAWKLQRNNKVKVLFGIRTTNEGRQYQTFYTRMFLRNGQLNYDRLEADVKSTQEAGGLPTSEFRVVPLQEYVVDSTPLETSRPLGENPFGDPNDNPFFQ